MADFDAGEPVARREDSRFLTGAGHYIADMVLAREAHAAFVRAPYAHADIVSVDCSAALDVSGTLGVFTAADIRAAGLGSLPTIVALKNRDGTPQARPARPVLAEGRVRYVGEPVALVVAETPNAALEAAEQVVVDYSERPAYATLDAATSATAAAIHDEAPGNVCLDWQDGDAVATEAAFAAAAHVVSLDVTTPRIAANPIEPRGAIAQYDRGLETYTLHVSSQGVHGLRNVLAEHVLHVPLNRLRVVTPDVGGGFGTKIFAYPEYAAILHAAHVIGRPVKWIASRAESFMGDAPARDHQSRAELALDADGRFLGLRSRTLANMGAYLSSYGTYIPTKAGTSVLTGLYDLPAVHCAFKCVFTNTVPVDAYRGAGKPEALFQLERLVDTAARTLGMSPVELRRRNLVPQRNLPYTTPLGYTFDSGDFEGTLDKALEACRWQDFEDRRATSTARGLRRGLGIAAYFENTAGYQDEHAKVHVSADGRFSVFIGTQSNGQGHETTFAQVLARELTVPLDHIRLVQGDTDMTEHGHGTSGSRSLAMGGAAVRAAAIKIGDKAKRIAAHLLEASETDIDLEDGSFRVAGTDRTVSFSEVAAAAYNPAKLPPGTEPGLVETGAGMPTECSFPNGFHICEVEVDPETGRTCLCSYWVVDDFGNMINPMIVEGQVHGGTVQGIGEALLEVCAYDETSGQILSGSFMDYAMPRADDLCGIDVRFNGTPCLTNPLGVKGCGEAGAVAAPVAVINAIVDALAADGVTHIDMAATPQRVWRALQKAKS